MSAACKKFLRFQPGMGVLQCYPIFMVVLQLDETEGLLGDGMDLSTNGDCPRHDILSLEASPIVRSVRPTVLVVTGDALWDTALCVSTNATKTRRERPKSAPYLRLKNIQGTTIGKIWKKFFFQKKF